MQPKHFWPDSPNHLFQKSQQIKVSHWSVLKTHRINRKGSIILKKKKKKIRRDRAGNRERKKKNNHRRKKSREV